MPKNTGCDIDASGATTLSHVLKVNTSLTHIDLRGLDCEMNQQFHIFRFIGLLQKTTLVMLVLKH